MQLRIIVALCRIALPSAAPALAAAQADARPATTVAMSPLPVARHGAIGGIVRDSLGEPVAYATIWRVGGEVALADEHGRFVLRGQPPGRGLFGARRIGYAPLFFEVEVPDTLTAVLAIRLSRTVHRLREVTVEEKRVSMSLARSGFFERQASGEGQFLLLTDIRTDGVVTLAQLLRRMQGIEVRDGGGMRSGGSMAFAQLGAHQCPLNVFVDGRRQAIDDAGLDLISPHVVAGIEVYSRTALVPGQFQVPGRLCGALIVWTKLD